MSDHTKEKIIRVTDIVFKWAVTIGAVIGAIFFMWMKQSFVTREEFNKLGPRIDTIERTLMMMANQERTLVDHEVRIRATERQLDRMTRDGSEKP